MKYPGRLVRVILFAAVIALAISCTKKCTTCSEEATYFGRWVWVISTGGYGGGPRTPESTGQTRALELSMDGVYRHYTDGAQVAQGHFSVNWEQPEMVRDSAFVLTSDYFFVSRQIIEWSADSLWLADLCFDCYWSTYVRAK